MIAIIDYEAGNLRSVERALKKLGVTCCITQIPQEIADAERIIFPGVGAAGKPIIGICLGTQIILEGSEENRAECLGLLKGKVKRFPEALQSGKPDGVQLKIPHMGWNQVHFKKQHPVFQGIRKEDEFYFVHSYYPSPERDDQIIGETEYGIRFPSIIGFRNLVAVQFHPEKSGRAGLKILGNFCEWDGHAE